MRLARWTLGLVGSPRIFEQDPPTNPVRFSVEWVSQRRRGYDLMEGICGAALLIILALAWIDASRNRWGKNKH